MSKQSNTPEITGHERAERSKQRALRQAVRAIVVIIGALLAARNSQVAGPIGIMMAVFVGSSILSDLFNRGSP